MSGAEGGTTGINDDFAARLVYGEYRRHMKTIGDNAQLEHHTLNATDSEIPRARQVDRLS